MFFLFYGTAVELIYKINVFLYCNIDFWHFWCYISWIAPVIGQGVRSQKSFGA